MNGTTVQLIALARRMASSGEARRIRQLARLSIHDLAADPRLGVAPSTISRWESGRRVPRGAAATAYGEVLAGLLDIVELDA